MEAIKDAVERAVDHTGTSKPGKRKFIEIDGETISLDENGYEIRSEDSDTDGSLADFIVQVDSDAEMEEISEVPDDEVPELDPSLILQEGVKRRRKKPKRYAVVEDWTSQWNSDDEEPDEGSTLSQEDEQEDHADNESDEDFVPDDDDSDSDSDDDFVPDE